MTQRGPGAQIKNRWKNVSWCLLHQLKVKSKASLASNSTFTLFSWIPHCCLLSRSGLEKFMVLLFKGLEKPDKSRAFLLSVWFSWTPCIKLEKGICFCLGSGLTSDQDFLSIVGCSGWLCHFLAYSVPAGICYFHGYFRKYESFSGGLVWHLDFFGAFP